MHIIIYRSIIIRALFIKFINLRSTDFYVNKLDYYIFFIKSFICYLGSRLIILLFSYNLHINLSLSTQML